VTAIHLRGEAGAVLYFSDAAALPEGVAHRVSRGDLVRVSPDGSPWDDSPPDQDPAAELPPDAPPLPGTRENRAAWTEFAISQGMDRAEANSLTKAQLIGRLARPPVP
jgi:hypothetical protein